MSIRSILLLGNEKLYDVSRDVSIETLPKARQVVEDLNDTIINFKDKFGFGRAIAAPQIGENLRIIYMHLGNSTHHFINPKLEFIDDDTFYMWDDCMSFPGLEVYLERHQRCLITYRDLDWNEHQIHLDGDLSELFQHEYDHLDGILATQKAKDHKAFRINTTKN